MKNNDVSRRAISVSGVVDLARQRAENCYQARRLCCSESVMLVCNQGFGGGLSPDTAIGLASGFCFGFGGAGGVCGALTGAIMAVSLFLGPHAPEGMKKKDFQKTVKELHQKFEASMGSSNCTILLDTAKSEKKAKKEFCRSLTGQGAALAVEVLLSRKNNLIDRVDLDFLRKRDSLLQSGLKQLIGGSK